MSPALRVLYVCTGNICRSPAAERLTRHLAGDLPLEASSAGTRAVTGSGIHARTALALERRGVSSSDHAARDLSTDVVRAADLVLTMTRAHRSAVVRLEPAALGRTFTLVEAARLSAGLTEGLRRSSRLDEWVAALAAARRAPRRLEDDDVVDPIGLDRAGHQDVVDRIAAEVDQLLASWPVAR